MKKIMYSLIAVTVIKPDKADLRMTNFQISRRKWKHCNTWQMSEEIFEIEKVHVPVELGV